MLARWQELSEDRPASHTMQLAQLLDSLDQRARPLASTLDVRPTLEFITGIYKSAATSRTVQRGSIVERDPFYSHVAGVK